MQYDIVFFCGHSGTVNLFGTNTERERKLRYFQTSGLCPACYTKIKRTETASEDLYIEATVLPSVNEETGDLRIAVWFAGNTMLHKDEIKALGRYHWDDLPTARSYFTMEKPQKVWWCSVDLSQLHAVLEEAYRIGAKKFDIW